MSTIKRNKPSLLVTNPELAKEWDYEKNGVLLPESVSYGTKEKVWWICEYGHEWKATPNNRVRGNKCPICSKSNRTFNRKAVICIETGKVYNSLKEACEQTNTTKSALSQCCKGKYKTAGGYHWKYCD